MKKGRTYLRCFMCGKQPVQVKRGRLVSHVTPGNTRCLAIGMRAEQVAAINKLNDQPGS